MGESSAQAILDFLQRVGEAGELVRTYRYDETRKNMLGKLWDAAGDPALPTAQKWRDALNNWGKMGRWVFHVCRDPQVLLGELAGIRQV